MGSLPAGTVTLLFSDVEGSTRLLQRLGPQWGNALSAQRAILRACFAEHGGHELGTEGDSFFVVFQSARGALAAALEAQRGLRAHPWPAGVPLRVRIGMHTGEPERHEDGYIGLDVHRAARIAATASGGQVVLSEATRVMVGTEPLGMVVRDLGWHRLKDLDDAEHLFDAVDDETVEAFPPLRSLGTRASLPVPSTALVGRTEELEALRARFETDSARLVTLTGSGGTGKTRLALATAMALDQLFPHGVFFVDLHTADRAELMWAGIADAVGAAGEADEFPDERVRRWIDDRRVLLLLDNLEQIHSADEVVAQLLAAAPGVRVLATSRRPLHLADEYEHPVPPLRLPVGQRTTVHAAARSSAVELFTQRAAMAHPQFTLTDANVDDVVELCRRLDGLPLALELAAARSRLLTPRAMLTRTDERLGRGVTAADRAPRQRSLGATIAWSYDLLEEDEQRTFRRLGVFSGRCDLAAVEAVAISDGDDAFDIVARLVDSSLVRVTDSPQGEPEITMLQTVRSFARDRLAESTEADAIRLRHARWCVAQTTGMVDLLRGIRRVSTLDRIATLEEDIRSALDWCLLPVTEVGPERARCGFELLAAMRQYWYRFGYVAEGRGWHERAVTTAGGADSGGLVDALHGLAIMMLQQSESALATKALDRALGMARRLGDLDREARESNSLAVAHRDVGDLAGARGLLERSIQLAREAGNDERAATAATNMVMLLIDSGDYEAAVAAGTRAVAADRARGDLWGAAINSTNLTIALLRTAGPARAFDHLVETAAEAMAQSDTELAIEIVELFAMALAELGHDAVLVGRLIGTADRLRAEIGIPRSLPNTVQLDRSIEPVRQSTSPEQWDRACAIGAQLGVEEAIAQAVEAGRAES